MNARRDNRNPGQAQSPGEVYIETQRIGSFVKVSAIDANTGIEVSIQGPASATQNELETIAINKLKYVMAKKSR